MLNFLGWHDWDTLAYWITAIATVALAIAAFVAMNSWKKEQQYTHIVEFIKNAVLLKERIDKYFDNGAINHDPSKMLDQEIEAWKPFYERDANKYTVESKELYDTLIKEKTYINVLNPKFNDKTINKFIKTIDEYRAKVDTIATAKINLFNQQPIMRRISHEMLIDAVSQTKDLQLQSKNSLKEIKKITK